ncbi:N-6 DNA methylase [Chitinophaga sp. RCC_12]|uniref:N-6 DNA methylase n=1 Tax=Chitinophaga sp. RCC_12 TaxID=3239226 RepID=UPI0035239C94
MSAISIQENMLREIQIQLSRLHDFSRQFDSGYTGRCVLAMVLLKYINDYQDVRYQQYLRQYQGDHDLINRKMERERFVLPLGTNFITLHKQIHSHRLSAGNILNQYTRSIELANEHKLGDLFRDVDFNNATRAGASESDWRQFLVHLVAAVGKMTLVVANNNNKEIVREMLLSRILSYWPIMSGFTGTEHFYAPTELHSLLIKLMAPKAGSRIFDPACNNGSLLIEAASAVTDIHNNPSDNYALYGQEALAEIVILTRIQMLLLELDDAQITIGDPIRSPLLTKEGELLEFDVLISNLPWNIHNWGHDIALNDKFNRFNWGIVPEMKGDWAYIQHMISAASPKGRIGVIIPHGLLFREGKEQQVRKAIVENNLLDAVIALPSNLFYFTKLPCVIILLDKNRGEKKEVLFINASGEFQADKRQNKLRVEDITHIVSVYKKFKEEFGVNNDRIEAQYSAVVLPQEIATNDYNFNVSRYVTSESNDTPLPMNIGELELDIEILKEELDEIRQNIKLNIQKLNIQ